MNLLLTWIGANKLKVMILSGFSFFAMQKPLAVNINIHKNDKVTTQDIGSFAQKELHSTKEKISRREKQIGYVSRFHTVAISEMNKFGIPASITLAQGILESSSGSSSLTQKTNNHFGVKCFSKKCSKGHCSNHGDDTHKDFFKIYTSSWDSFRDHSLVLKKDRYAFLYSYDQTDYVSWAHGLSKAGYATDPRYPNKLIKIIESLELWRYDS